MQYFKINITHSHNSFIKSGPQHLFLALRNTQKISVLLLKNKFGLQQLTTLAFKLFKMYSPAFVFKTTRFCTEGCVGG